MIWFDIVCMPEYYWFSRLMDEFPEAIVTARKDKCLEDLLTLKGVKYWAFGRHGKNLEEKLISYLERVLGIAELFRETGDPDLLISHSASATRVAFGLGIPSVYVMDDPHAEAQSRLALPISSRVIVSSWISEERIVRLGAKRNDIVKFHGTLERAYLGEDFKPENLKIRERKREEEGDLVLIRPEPLSSSFMMKDPSSTRAKEIISEFLKRHPENTYLLFPRDEKQANYLKRLFPEIEILREIVDGPSLIYWVDFLVGGGATMNREASLLGTPNVSFYPELLEIDSKLMELGFPIKHCLSPKETVDFYEYSVLKEKVDREEVREMTKELEDPTEVVLNEVEELVP